MNVCYTMGKPDLLPVLFYVLVLVATQVFSDPVDYPEDPETTRPVVTPSEPLSRIVFVNDLPPGETTLFEFVRGAKVYVTSSRDTGAAEYEENIHILFSGVDGDFRKMSEVGGKVNKDTGEKTPLFVPLLNRIAIRNNNSVRSTTKNPGIIYFLSASDDKHFSNVYESDQHQKVIVFVRSDNIENQYVTLLNPTGAVRISNIHFIDGLAALTVTAGGLEETRSTNFTIHDIGKDAALTESPLHFVEPVLTFHKQLALFPGSAFEFTAAGKELSDYMVVPMKWSDWSLGMSRNYMLRNESTSFKHIFNATEPDSEFDIQMFGEIGEGSSLKVSYDGLHGAGSEIFEKQPLERLTKSMKGQKVTVEYQRAPTDTTKGVLVRVECSQSATQILLHSTFLFTLLRHLL
ncbi:hypothetical protein L5515_011595 [Caenorhabditis briggsae]|uniref:Uncharacterized protein n=1 Tax=Caenorhabditis briggsae TaxID=6238 RepID=A0AAE9JGM7_CAEBR|nr:hypothetical protein L5515_011595 [Caenorhabditis briggsae]